LSAILDVQKQVVGNPYLSPKMGDGERAIFNRFRSVPRSIWALIVAGPIVLYAYGTGLQERARALREADEKLSAITRPTTREATWEGDVEGYVGKRLEARSGAPLGHNGSLFEIRTFEPPPPPVVVVAPPPPPPPSAPPLPFTYAGRMVDAGNQFLILQRNGALELAAVGGVLDGTYRIDSATDSEVRFFYLPLSQAQVLPIPPIQ
jgi:hypothetical protein